MKHKKPQKAPKNMKENMQKQTKNNVISLNGHALRTDQEAPPTPFRNAEEAWFWFIETWTARQEGARIVAGAGTILRPCEPVDIFNVVDRLHRNRRLKRDHLLVLRHYGRRFMPPDARRAKEAHAHHLWHEALNILSPALEAKGIVAVRHWLDGVQK